MKPMNEILFGKPTVERKNAEKPTGVFHPSETPEATITLNKETTASEKPLDREFENAPLVNEQAAAQEIKKRIAELRGYLQRG